MPPRLKKLVGTLLIVVLVIVYALVATAIAVAHLAESPWWVHLLYFLFTGVLWVVPAMFLIVWMERSARRRRE
jgi:RsiW-degrading membrane proteinase PrsW (M82 family)